MFLCQIGDEILVKMSIFTEKMPELMDCLDAWMHKQTRAVLRFPKWIEEPVGNKN